MWVRGQHKIAEGVRHCKRHHKRALRIAGFTNKLACIWIPCRDARAHTFQPFNGFGRYPEELWYSEEKVSVEGLQIDIFDAGSDDDSEEEDDSDPANSDDDEHDRAMSVAERVAIAMPNDDEAESDEAESDADLVVLHCELELERF